MDFQSIGVRNGGGGGGMGAFFLLGGIGMFVPPPPPPTHTHTFNPTFFILHLNYMFI